MISTKRCSKSEIKDNNRELRSELSTFCGPRREPKFDRGHNCEGIFLVLTENIRGARLLEHAIKLSSVSLQADDQHA